MECEWASSQSDLGLHHYPGIGRLYEKEIAPLLRGLLDVPPARLGSSTTMQPAATSTMKCSEAEPTLVTMAYTPTLEGMNGLLIQLQGDGRSPGSLLTSRQLSPFKLAKLHDPYSHTAVGLLEGCGGYLSNNDRTYRNIPISSSTVAIRN